MVETYYPFAVPPGNTLTETQWSQMMRYALGTGVMAVPFNDNLNELLVSPGASPLTVDIDTGSAWIQGHYYQNDSINTLTVPPNPSTGIRADLIVLNCKWGLNAGITAQVMTGVNGAVWPVTDPRSGTPMPPTPVQTYGVLWQLPLAQVNTAQNQTTVYPASSLIDLRNFSGANTAQAVAIIVAMPNASDNMRQNADFQIPSTAYYPADEVINEAFGALPACGGTVLISEGDCYIADDINPISNSIFAGCGSQTTITLSPTAAVGPMISILEPTVEVHDMVLNGGGSTTSIYTSTPAAGSGPGTGSDGIYIASSYANIHNVTINNAQNYGINVAQVGGVINRVNIKDCSISYAYSDGLFYQGNLGIVSDNQIAYCGDVGLHISCPALMGVQANKFEDNLITYCGLHGIQVDGTAAGCSLWYNMISANEVGQCGMTGTGSPSCINLIGAGCKATSLISNYAWTANSPYTKYGIGISSNAVQDTRGIGNDMYDSSAGTGAYDIILNGATFNSLGLNLYSSHAP